MLVHLASESRFLFFIPTLETGGAERVCLSYMNNLTRLRPVLAVQFRSGPLLTDLGAGVPVYETVQTYQMPRTKTPGRFGTLSAHAVGVPHAMLSHIPFLSKGLLLLKQARYLARLAQECQCPGVSSFMTMPNIIAILAKVLFARSLKVVINVHDVTSRVLVHSRLKLHERVLLRWLVRVLYPRADLVVAVAVGIKVDLVRTFGIPADRVAVVHNPIDTQGICARSSEPVDHPWLGAPAVPVVVAVGRLVKLKGFDLLIRAMAQLPSHLNARLLIVGEGEERSSLERLVMELGLAERVTLVGFEENPWKFMARTDMFVLSSLTEGWPNVIGEAMALGLPIVATDCSAGVREFLEEGKLGLLVPPGDSKALAEGIMQVLQDEALRTEFSRRAPKRVAQFDLPNVVRVYEDLLLGLLPEAE